jgi:hypothetical protein
LLETRGVKVRDLRDHAVQDLFVGVQLLLLLLVEVLASFLLRLPNFALLFVFGFVGRGFESQFVIAV